MFESGGGWIAYLVLVVVQLVAACQPSSGRRASRVWLNLDRFKEEGISAKMYFFPLFLLFTGRNLPVWALLMFV